MKNSLKVFRRDIKSIIKNPITLIIITGICFIPSLYAWVNIKACWNPYVNTGTVPVAIVNNDTGASMNGKDINIGNNVIEQLKDNKKIGWKFVDSKEGNYGIVTGKYYAMIEIPANFSKDLTSLVSNNPVKPEIIYKVDTKANAVAGKITEVAKSTLVNQISSNFVDAVSTIVFSKLNILGENINKNKENIIKLKNAIIDIHKNMGFITDELETLSNNSSNLNEYLTSLKTALPTLNNSLNNLEGSTNNSKNLILNTKETLNKSFNNLNQNLNGIEAAKNNISSLISRLKNLNNENSPETGNLIISKINSNVDSINNNINSNINFLEAINKVISNKKISNNINSLKQIQNSLKGMKDNTTNIQKEIVNGKKLNSNILNTITNTFNNCSNQIKASINEFSSATMPALNDISNNLINATDSAVKIINTTKGIVPQINNLLTSGTEGSSLAQTTSTNLNKNLNQFKGLIGNLSSKLEEVNNNDLTKIITVLQGNPEFMGNFISNPFNIKQEAIYKVPNYGSGMAPIYSVLATWVGGLILTSLLTTNALKTEIFENMSIRERHYGKLLTFMFLASIQGFIIAVGDIFLLKVHTVSPLLLVTFSVTCSITFSIIIFTLVSLFGNVGKGLAILFMVFQIAGCGGTYPIQVDPTFFRIVQPFFPFTYGVGGFREAIAGPLFSSVILDFICLFLFALGFLILGFFLKPVLNDRVEAFEEKFRKSTISR